MLCITKGDGRNSYARGTNGGGVRAYVGHKQLVLPDFQHRFLVVQSGNARAGQHVHIALGFQKANQCGKIAGLKRKPKQCSPCPDARNIASRMCSNDGCVRSTYQVARGG